MFFTFQSLFWMRPPNGGPFHFHRQIKGRRHTVTLRPHHPLCQLEDGNARRPEGIQSISIHYGTFITPMWHVCHRQAMRRTRAQTKAAGRLLSPPPVFCIFGLSET
jgi:hypothetical protein